MVKIIKDILPTKTNLSILKLLSENKNWGFSVDGDQASNLDLLMNGKCMGFFTQTLLNNKPLYDTPLNFFGKIITDIVTDKLGIKEEIDIHRFYWNMYLPGNHTEIHDDGHEENLLTIIYNIHTTDGGTEIDGNFYKDERGEAKVFKSRTPHKGVAPINDNIRFNLNIVLMRKI